MFIAIGGIGNPADGSDDGPDLEELINELQKAHIYHQWPECRPWCNYRDVHRPPEDEKQQPCVAEAVS